MPAAAAPISAAHAIETPSAGADPVRPRRPESLAEWRAARRPAVEGARPTYVVRRALLPVADWVGEDADGEPMATEPAPAASVAAVEEGAPSAALPAGAEISGEGGVAAVRPLPSAVAGGVPPASALAVGDALRPGDGAAVPMAPAEGTGDAAPAAPPGPDPVEALLAAIAAKVAQDRGAGGDGAAPAAAEVTRPQDQVVLPDVQEPRHEADRAGSHEHESTEAGGESLGDVAAALAASVAASEAEPPAGSEAAPARDEETPSEDPMGAFRRAFAEHLARQDGMPARPSAGAGHPAGHDNGSGEGDPSATGAEEAATAQAGAASPDPNDVAAPAATFADDLWMWGAAGDGGAGSAAEPVQEDPQEEADAPLMPEAAPGMTAEPAGQAADGADDAPRWPGGAVGEQPETDAATAAQAPPAACPDGPDEAGTSLAAPPSGPAGAGPEAGVPPAETVAAGDTPQPATPAGKPPAVPETAGAAGGCPDAEPGSGETPEEDVATGETSEAGSDAAGLAEGVARRDDAASPDPAPVVPLRLHPSVLPQELAGLVARLEQPPTVVEGPVAPARRPQGMVSVAAMLAERRARFRPRPAEAEEQDFGSG
jgi:hypothetical protein